jgi:hypothetical protein
MVAGQVPRWDCGARLLAPDGITDAASAAGSAHAKDFIPDDIGSNMDAGFLAPLIPIVAIISAAAVMIVRMRATHPGTPSVDVTARLDALERSLQDVHQELAETQERLDFAERLLSQAREDRRLGG